MAGNHANGAEPQHWHAHAGDGIADDFNVPGIFLCMIGIGALAATLTAAASGHYGWMIVGGAVTLVAWVAGISELLFEHKREERLEKRYGRNPYGPGHAPV